MLRPLIVNLLTAFLLFFVALVFKPDILDFIHGRPLDDYPIMCIAEPYAGEKRERYE